MVRQVPEGLTQDVAREEIVARRRDPSLLLVDVLPAASYEGGHLPGALSLPLADIPQRAEIVLPDKSREIVVYCGSFT